MILQPFSWNVYRGKRIKSDMGYRRAELKDKNFDASDVASCRDALEQGVLGADDKVDARERVINYKIPLSRRAFWRIVSLTAAKTSRI